jgi:hypothetical protein
MKEMAAGDWLSLDEKRLSWHGPGIAFSMLTQTSLPKPPERAASITSTLESMIWLSFGQSHS